MGRFVRASLVAGIFGVSVLASHVQGVPPKLPGAALEWRLLFHVERAAALLGTTGLIALVTWRTVNGVLPTRIGQLEYPISAADTVERRLKALEDYLGL